MTATVRAAVTAAAPLVVLAGVSARDRAAARGWSLFRRSPMPIGAITDIRLERGVGVAGIVGATEDGAAVLANVLAGRFRPERGKVLVAGLDPSRSAAARAKIGALTPAPELVPAKTVLASVAASLAMTGGDAGGASALLAEMGLERLADRALPALSSGETRAVELALALSSRAPALVVLYEPLADVAGVPESVLREKVAAIAERAAVVVISSSPSDVQAFVGEQSDAIYTLHRGTLARQAGSARALGAFERCELHVWVGKNGRELAKALSTSASVRGIAWEVTGEGPNETGVLRIAGPDRSAVALAVTDAAVAVEAIVTGITEIVPTLGEIRATTEWTKQAQYAAAHAAYREAYAKHANQIQQAQVARQGMYAQMQAPTTWASPSGAAAIGPQIGPAIGPEIVPAAPESITEQEAKWGPKAPVSAADSEPSAESTTGSEPANETAATTEHGNKPPGSEGAPS